jgi:hypothetical protein
VQRLAASVQDLWNAAVVTFDQSTQERLLGQGGDGTGRSFFEAKVRSVQRMLRRVSEPGGDAAAWGARIMLVGAATLIIGMCWVGVRAVRRSLLQLSDGPGWAMNGPERRAYRTLLRLLAQRGYPKPGWLPPLQHLKVVADRDAVLAAGAGEVVTLLYRSRFGGGAGHDVSTALRRLRELSDSPRA